MQDIPGEDSSLQIPKVWSERTLKNLEHWFLLSKPLHRQLDCKVKDPPDTTEGICKFLDLLCTDPDDYAEFMRLLEVLDMENAIHLITHHLVQEIKGFTMEDYVQMISRTEKPFPGSLSQEILQLFTYD